GDGAVERSDRGKQGGPLLERSVFHGAIIDRRVIAQGGPVHPAGDAAYAQIGLGRCAGNKAAGMKETTSGFGGSAFAALRRDKSGWRGRTGQGEIATRFDHGVAEALQVAVAGDEVKKIAMLAGGSVGPFAGGAAAVIGPLQPDIKAAAWRVHGVARDPVAARTAPVGEVMTAHGLGIARGGAPD